MAWANGINVLMCRVHRHERGCKLKILQRTIRTKSGRHCTRIRFEEDPSKDAALTFGFSSRTSILKVVFLVYLSVPTCPLVS